MGQKTNPIGNRLGIIRGWDSSWYGGKDFAFKLIEDDKIRKYLNARLAKAGISRIIIGKGGTEVDKLKEELKKLTGKEIQINISEIKRPEIDAVIVAAAISKQIEGRISYRRAIKTSIASAMRIGAEGIKVQISGRLGGAEMARREQYKEGRIPLHTLRADIDYSLCEAHTTYGRVGVKVWICKGEIYGKVDLVPSTENVANKSGKSSGPGGQAPRGGKPNAGGAGRNRNNNNRNKR